MAAGEITEAVKEFIHQHINSVEQLEVLLWILNHDDRGWSVAEVSRELYIQPESAGARLTDLQRSGLLEADQSTPVAFRYAPATTEMDHAAREVAAAYSVRRVGIINLILEKPLDNVRVFSNAFRFRRD